MAYAKGVVFAFFTFRETGDAAILAVRMKYIAATCQNFMTIRLVAYIPNKLVVRRVKYIMERCRDLNYT